LAQGLYRTCTIVDANFVAPAAFGLARTRLAEGDVQSALAALDLIGPTSGSYVTARRTRAEVLAGSDAGLAALSEAVSTLARIPIDPLDRQQLVVRVLNLALEHVRNTGRDEPSVRVASVPAAERDLRQGLERAYRELAALTSDRAERVRLVDAANDVRPRTLL
jgi:serine/threonine-protein kinase PknG